MRRLLQPFVAVALALTALPAAKALTVFDYNSVVHERFSSGFPSGPTSNPLFFLSNYDLSGIGWTSGAFGMTLISPQHFLTAAHVAPANNATINFLSAGGTLRTYTVDSTFTIQHTAGVSSDLVVGRLTEPISGADQVTYYPTLVLNSSSEYLGMIVAAFGSGQRAGTNTIDALGNADMLPFGNPDAVNDNVVFVTDFDSVTGETQGQAGDSGSPSFVDVNGSLALLGTHSAIGATQTFDVFIPSYFSQINTQLGFDGYSFGAFVAVPEPTTWAVTCGLLALGVSAFRRRRCN